MFDNIYISISILIIFNVVFMIYSFVTIFRVKRVTPKYFEEKYTLWIRFLCSVSMRKIEENKINDMDMDVFENRRKLLINYFKIAFILMLLMILYTSAFACAIIVD